MTDTITLPRAVIEQAIESMQGYARETGDTQPCDAEKALRAALAQQAEPVIVKAITEVEPNENQTPIAWINWNAATGERSVSFEQESELASQPLYYTPVTGYDLDEITDLKEERERQRDHAVGEIQKLIARNAELESHMQGLSNEINDFQNTIERLTKKVAERSAEHLAAHITHDKGYQEGMIDSQNGFEKYLKEGETPLQRLEREIKDGSALMRIYGKALTQIQELQAQQAEPAPAAWKTQFLSDALTAAGMIAYGRIDKKMAERLSAGVVKFRSELFARPQVAQQAEQGWQPIDTAPKDGAEVLLGEPDGSITVAYWNERNVEFTTDGGYDAPWATHWMPLPASPKGWV